MATPHGMRGLSTLNRDQTHVPWIGSTEVLITGPPRKSFLSCVKLSPSIYTVFFGLFSNNTSSIYSVSDKLTQGIEEPPWSGTACALCLRTCLSRATVRVQSLAPSFHSTIICFPKQAWFLRFILFTWKLMLCCLEAAHSLLLFSIYVISFFLFISHVSPEFKLFGDQELAMAFSFFFFFVVLEFCILLVTDVKFRCGVIKTNEQTNKYLT